MQAWSANMDIKLIYSIECLADYLCAYATKCEKLSKQALRTMSTCTRHFDDTTSIQKIVRSMFIRGHGQRDMSAQEVAHCNLNMPLVRQNVKYMSLDLRKGPGIGSRRLQLDGDTGPLVVPSIMESYGQRCDECLWAEGHQEWALKVEDFSLNDFVLQFNVNKQGKLVPRAQQNQEIFIVNAVPRIRALQGGKLYPEYCKLQLTLYHPWVVTPPWSADEEAVTLWESVSGKQGLLDAAIVRATAALEDPSEAVVMSVDSMCDELQGLHDAVFKEASDAFDNVGCNQVHFYDAPISHFVKSLDNAKKAAQDQRTTRNKRNIVLDEAQQSVVETFCTSQNGLMLLIGAGGTGKSEIVFRIKELLNESASITATTGKAAALIDGATVHCVLNIPIKVADKRSLGGPTLEKMQNRFKNVTNLIIDEFSMMNGEFLYWIDRRCKEAKHCENLAFGGMSILLAGDPAQLAPMGGTPLWVEANSSTSNNEALGKCLYSMFKTVFFLTMNYRQGSAHARDLAAFLANYRNGSLTNEDWFWFESRSREQVSEIEFTAASEAGIHLFPTNEKVREYNFEKLQQISVKESIPVAIFPAKNSCARAATASNKLAGGLDKVLTLCLGASVMVTQNLWTEQGIVNGASGRVIDFIKDGDECVAIVVDVPKYRGPPLCGEAVERRTWIPIQRQEATWCTGRNAHTCKREQFPLTLSYAVTIHKSQGSSFDVPVVVDIGKADQTCGSTYVAMSRCTASDQIFHSGYARERITKNFASPAFICRMKEEKRLLRLHSLRIHVPENQ
jgi:hypothetical protein